MDWFQDTCQPQTNYFQSNLPQSVVIVQFASKRKEKINKSNLSKYE